MMKWKCTVCGYIYEGAMPPQKCPICGVGPEKFVPVPEAAPGSMPPEKYKQLEQLLFNASYGLYVVTSVDGDRQNGMLSNSFLQLSSDPLKASVCLNKGTYTGELVQKSGVFGVSILGQDNHDLVPRFGYQSAHSGVDKFAGIDIIKGDVTGCPGVTSTLCFMELEVEQVVDVGTHNLFIGRLVGGKDFRKGEPMTYAYYRKTR
ncbi:MAG: flavin reductase [Eubacterium aggregans]|uniref:flavin reductase n=1 Tax=Eubacterium aggregans TaxID=81409 RepID=UPI000B7ED193|nr:flavin reductase [Eubacterium aggregans]MEA5074342.1 flavin reductase [Eubacterium aggregans]